MRDAENIQALCSLNVQYIGFIFYPQSSRYAQYSLTPQIANSIPSDITRTGVFVNEEIDLIKKTANKYGCKAIQLHGSETPELCKTLKRSGFEVTKAFGVSDSFCFDRLAPYKNSCDYFLFDTKSDKHGGTGKKFNWEILRKYDNSKPIFLSGGISTEDITAIKGLTWLDIYSLDLNSKFEIAPAIKDIPLIRSFISRLGGGQPNTLA